MMETVSAPAPLHVARNTTSIYFAPDGVLPSIRDLLGSSGIQEHLLSRGMRTCLQVMFVYALRSAEVLSIRGVDYVGACRWYVAGAKGSRGTLCFLPGSHTAGKFLSESHPLYPLFPYTYNELYRACVKIGAGMHLESHSNVARTHASRYIVARRAVSISGVKSAQDALRHRRITSTNYYLISKEG